MPFLRFAHFGTNCNFEAISYKEEELGEGIDMFKSSKKVTLCTMGEEVGKKEERFFMPSIDE